MTHTMPLNAPHSLLADNTTPALMATLVSDE